MSKEYMRMQRNAAIDRAQRAEARIAELEEQVRRVCAYSWPDCDPDAIRELETLCQMVEVES